MGIPVAHMELWCRGGLGWGVIKTFDIEAGVGANQGLGDLHLDDPLEEAAQSASLGSHKLRFMPIQEVFQAHGANSAVVPPLGPSLECCFRAQSDDSLVST